MSGSGKRDGVSTAGQGLERRPAIEGLRAAVNELFGAERRLRSRDHNRAGELTQAQLRALAALGREHEMTAGQLARSADLNPATVTALLDHLEAAEIVQRNRSTEDRRVCNVSLTPAGRQLLDRKLTYWYSLWDERFADLPNSDLQVAARVLSEIAGLYDALGAHLGNPPAADG